MLHSVRSIRCYTVFITHFPVSNRLYYFICDKHQGTKKISNNFSCYTTQCIIILNFGGSYFLFPYCTISKFFHLHFLVFLVFSELTFIRNIRDYIVTRWQKIKRKVECDLQLWFFRGGESEQNTKQIKIKNILYFL